MIVHHESISAVGDMAFLKYLNLNDNPVTYIRNHREITCGYLHENAAIEFVSNFKYNYKLKCLCIILLTTYPLLQFELDNRLLSKSEKQFVGQSSRSLDLSFLHYQQPPSKLLIYK